MTVETQTADVLVENHGTLWLFNLLTDSAREWVDSNVEVPDYMWRCGGFCCEHRCGPSLVEGMREEGLTVE